MDYLQPIATDTSDFVDLFDELPLWSAPFALRLLEHVPMKAGQSVLDVGAGTGFLAIELAERCGPTAQIYAVDPWTAALERLKKKIHQRRLSNIRVLELDAASLPIESNSIDVIVSNLGINNFADPNAVMRSCNRVAKPRATLAVTSNLQGHMAEFYTVLEDVLLEMDLKHRLESLEAHVQHRGTVDSVCQLVADHGFAPQQVIRDTFHWRFADGSALLRHFFIRLGFLPAWKEVVGDENAEWVFPVLEQRLNAYAALQGTLSLTIPAVCIIAEKIP